MDKVELFLLYFSSLFFYTAFAKVSCVGIKRRVRIYKKLYKEKMYIWQTNVRGLNGPQKLMEHIEKEFIHVREREPSPARGFKLASELFPA